MIDQYISSIKTGLDMLDKGSIGNLVDLLQNALKEQRTIFICGNGGSASTASHFANDLSKGAVPDGQTGYRAVSLTDCIPLVTAWANDSSYEEIFEAQLRCLFQAKDILIGLSSSGNSPNVIRAVDYANRHGGVTVGFCGRDGGQLLKRVQISIHVALQTMEQIEDIHLIVEHMVISILRSLAKGV